MIKNDGGLAFPRPWVGTNEGYIPESWEIKSQQGMTLRDWFAGQALVRTEWEEIKKNRLVNSEVASDCYSMADAMLKERNNTHDNEEKE